MTVVGASPFVQNAYDDQFGAGFAGQISSTQDIGVNNMTKGYSTESLVFCGRAVVKFTIQNFTNNNIANTKPFTIELPETGSVVADLLGVVVRPYTVTQSFEDTDSVLKAGFGATEVVPVLEFGTKQRIRVRQDPGLGAITYGDPVYVAIDPANSLGLFIGEFSNVAAATPAHTLLVPNAIWYEPKDAATAIDSINQIQLL